MENSLSKRLLQLLLLPCLILGGITYFSFSAAKKLVEIDLQERDSHQRLIHLQKMLTLVTDIETGQRGYVITGDHVFLEPYENAHRLLPAQKKFLRKGISGVPMETLYGEIEFLISRRVRLADEVVRTFQVTGAEGARKIIDTGAGRAVMDQVRKKVQQIESEENKILKDLTKKSEMNIRRLSLISGSGFFAAVLMMVAGWVYISRSVIKSLAELSRWAQLMGDGEFSFFMPSFHFKEIEKLSLSFKQMGERIFGMLRKEKEQTLISEKLASDSVVIGNLALSSSEIQVVLQKIVETARSLVSADFAALGIGNNPEHPFDPWVFSGVSENLKQTLGRNPRPVGLLGLVACDGQRIRVPDLNKDPAFSGFPKHHPEMGPLLAVPIHNRGKTIGNLYLAKAPGSEVFSEQDLNLMNLLASNSGIILENSRLNTDLGRAITARDDVLAIVSHDLKSPLSAILLSVGLLSRKASDKSELEWMNHLLAKIETSTVMMQRLISDLLDVSAIEAGKIQINLEETSQKKIFEGLEAQFEEQARAKKIQLEFQTVPSEFSLRCDRGRLQQVISNLIGNALKFTPENGRVQVSSELENNWFVVRVEDSGPGISDENQTHLFERFWQIKHTRQLGSGLGLFIAKGIVDAHGGTLLVESKPGHGSIFSFRVPV